MNRALTLTSPLHAAAVTLAAIQLAVSLLLIFGVANTRALDNELGGLGDLVPAALLVGSIGVIASMVASDRAARRESRHRQLFIRGECVASALLGGVSVAYFASMFHAYGFAAGPTTQTYALCIGLGYFARAAQAYRETQQLRRADPPLAEVPKDHKD